MDKIAFYCRVSTEKQEREDTIESQLYVLNAIYNGKDVVEKYLDNGYRGGILERPELMRMREDAKLGKFNVLALSDLSRSTRGGTVHLEPLFRELVGVGSG